MQRRTLTHELMAEFFGTFLLILGGDGVVANVGLAPRLASQGYDWNTIVWGWGLSVMVAVYVAGGVSGAHINPAVTLALAVKRGFSWGKVLPYFVAQIAGAFVGALGVYLAYRDGLVAAGMPNVWCTGPGSVFAGSLFWRSRCWTAVSRKLHPDHRHHRGDLRHDDALAWHCRLGGFQRRRRLGRRLYRRYDRGRRRPCSWRPQWLRDQPGPRLWPPPLWGLVGTEGLFSGSTGLSRRSSAR